MNFYALVRCGIHFRLAVDFRVYHITYAEQPCCIPLLASTKSIT